MGERRESIELVFFVRDVVLLGFAWKSVEQVQCFDKLWHCVVLLSAVGFQHLDGHALCRILARGLFCILFCPSRCCPSSDVKCEKKHGIVICMKGLLWPAVSQRAENGKHLIFLRWDQSCSNIGWEHVVLKITYSAVSHSYQGVGDTVPVGCDFKRAQVAEKFCFHIGN